VIRAAAYSEALPGGGIVCTLCPVRCRFREGRRGVCGSRFMRDGELLVDNYGEAVTLALDPIEKKPLYHFHPGTDILSTGPNSCNLGCRHCQNWAISQERAETKFVSPESLAAAARRYGAFGVAFTYTEPLMWFEYIRDVAPILRQAGLAVVLVTNGYIEAAPLEELIPLVDAMNVDLKGMAPSFYRTVCKGRVEPVLHTIRRSAEAGVHVEVTNLVIPTLNDCEEDIRKLTAFVASVSERIPLHFSAYRPEYKMRLPATPAGTLVRAREIAQERLWYVYLGNVSVPGGGDTLCRGCGKSLVERRGYRTEIIGMDGSRCSSCGFEAGIVR